MQDTENGIAAAFGRKFKLVPSRTGDDIPNFIFYESPDGIHPEGYKGAGWVMRCDGNKDKLLIPLDSLKKLLDKDKKGIVLVGFDDVAVFSSPSKTGFVVEGGVAVLTDLIKVVERKGLYE